MANTKNTTINLYGQRHTVIYWTLVYVDSDETAAIVYDSSVVATALGIADPLNCYINSVKALIQSTSGTVRLDFDATTDVLAIPFPKSNNPVDMCFEREGGLKNYSGTGKTGDILITTSGLGAGDRIMIVLDVRAVA